VIEITWFAFLLLEAVSQLWENKIKSGSVAYRA
jgi:hypothetical protein